MTRVLIVDDRADNRYMLRALMQGHGFEVVEASQGAEAITKAGVKPPDLVVTDLLMPEMDGYTLLREWKSRTELREIPVIVYTATYTQQKDEELARELGADAFLIKPTEPDEFMACVRRTMMKVRLSRESRQPAKPDQLTMKLYNEVLVRKLESRSHQLEQRVAELCRSQLELQRLGARLAVLSGVNHAIVHMAGREAFLDTACRVIVEQGRFGLAWIGLLDAASRKVVPVARHGAGLEMDSRGPLDIAPSACGPIAIALQSGGLHVSNDIASDPALEPVAHELLEAGLRSTAACPLRVGADIVGALALFATGKDCFDDACSALVRDLAAGISFALEQAEREAVRKHSEEELKNLNDELEDRIRDRTMELTSANDELRAFSYSVSHDLRAPLAAISGFTGNVLEKYRNRALDEYGASLLQRVLAAAERMDHLTGDLLNLSRVSEHEARYSDVSLSALSQQVLDALQEAHGNRSVSVTVQPGIEVHADAGLMRILLENLIGNAWKFTSRIDRPSIQVGARADHGEMAFFVRDNGVGFDMEHAGKLFIPFQRLHSASDFKGSGIGLSIARRIVAKHGGRIWAEAAPDQGATFLFTLKTAAARPALSLGQASR